MRNLEARLGEDTLGNEFLTRPQTKDAKAIEPFGDRIPNAMGEPSCGRKVDLIPASLAIYSRSDRARENPHRKLGDRFGKAQVHRRVLLNMSRQRATVTDQMAEQGKLVIAHGLLRRS